MPGSWCVAQRVRSYLEPLGVARQGFSQGGHVLRARRLGAGPPLDAEGTEQFIPLFMQTVAQS